MGLIMGNISRPAILLLACLVVISAFAPVVASAQSALTGFTVYSFYDADRRLVGRVQPSPTNSNYPAERMTYDGLGHLVLKEIGYLATWQPLTQAPSSWLGFAVVRQDVQTYDPFDREIQNVESSSGVTISLLQKSYDQLDRVKCSTIRMNLSSPPPTNSDACSLGTAGSNGADRITSYVYDAAGQLLQERHAVGTPLEQAYETHSYSLNGKQLTVADANANLTTMAYDGFDRLIQINYPAVALGAGVSNPNDYEAYTYDANGNRLTERRRDGAVITYAYDARNRQVQKAVPGSPVVYTSYDQLDHVTASTFTSSSGPGITYRYDGAGRLTGETSGLGSLAYGYDPDGNRTAMTWPDGFQITYSYDGADHLSSVAEVGGITLDSFSYDALGRLTSVSRGNGSTSSIAYDPVDRLASLSHSFPASGGSNVTYGFSYTPASQIVSQSISNSLFQWASPAVSQSKAYDGLNRDAAIAAVSNGYDARGNLTFDGTRTFSYDEENRLLTETGPVSASLSYDPLGRLSTSVINGATTQFLYSGQALVAEYDGSGNLLRRYAHGVGTDIPLVWYEGSGTGSRRWLHTDRQGSVVAWSDLNGALPATYTYGPYGEPNSWGGSRFRYTGQIELPELQLYHYKARVYDPNMGRFLQTDPVGYKDGPDWYLYVHDDPLNHADPTGLECVSRPNGGQTCTVDIKANPIVLAVISTLATISNAAVHTYETVTGQSDSKSDATAAVAAKTSNSYTVRVQAQGAALSQPNTSNAISQTSPVTASQVQAGLAQTATQLTRSDQKTLNPAFEKASAWVDRVAAAGGTAPVSKSFYVPGISGSQARVDIEVIRGSINIVPDK